MEFKDSEMTKSSLLINPNNFTSKLTRKLLEKLLSIDKVITQQHKIYICLIIGAFPEDDFRKIINYSRITIKCWTELKNIKPFDKILINYTNRDLLNVYKNLVYLNVFKKFGPIVLLEYFEKHYEEFSDIKKISFVNNILYDKIPEDLAIKSKESILTESSDFAENDTELVEVKSFNKSKVILIESNSPNVKLELIARMKSYLSKKGSRLWFSRCKNLFNLNFPNVTSSYYDEQCYGLLRGLFYHKFIISMFVLNI